MKLGILCNYQIPQLIQFFHSVDLNRVGFMDKHGDIHFIKLISPEFVYLEPIFYAGKDLGVQIKVKFTDLFEYEVGEVSDK